MFSDAVIAIIYIQGDRMVVTKRHIIIKIATLKRFIRDFDLSDSDIAIIDDELYEILKSVVSKYRGKANDNTNNSQ